MSINVGTAALCFQISTLYQKPQNEGNLITVFMSALKKLIPLLALSKTDCSQK